jgi:SAM-dependent methyltransferase
MVDSASELDDGYNQVVSHHYDAAYATLPSLGPDVDFYARLAEESGGRALELGCGTGRVLLELVARGVDGAGVDSSPSMLDVLRGKPGARDVRLWRAQMQRFDLAGSRFPFIYSAFRVFQHLYSIDDQLGCLRCVRDHLEPGGCFAFDVFNPRLERVAQSHEPEVQDLSWNDGTDVIRRYVSVERRVAEQMMTLDMRFERRRDGVVVGAEHERIHLRWFHRFELLHLLARGGFNDVEIYGDFDGSAVTTRSPALVVVARVR